MNTVTIAQIAHEGVEMHKDDHALSAICEHMRNRVCNEEGLDLDTLVGEPSKATDALEEQVCHILKVMYDILHREMAQGLTEDKNAHHA